MQDSAPSPDTREDSPLGARLGSTESQVAACQDEAERLFPMMVESEDASECEAGESPDSPALAAAFCHAQVSAGLFCKWIAERPQSDLPRTLATLVRALKTVTSFRACLDMLSLTRLFRTLARKLAASQPDNATLQGLMKLAHGMCSMASKAAPNAPACRNGQTVLFVDHYELAPLAMPVHTAISNRVEKWLLQCAQSPSYKVPTRFTAMWSSLAQLAAPRMRPTPHVFAFTWLRLVKAGVVVPVQEHACSAIGRDTCITVSPEAAAALLPRLSAAFYLPATQQVTLFAKTPKPKPDAARAASTSRPRGSSGRSRRPKRPTVIGPPLVANSNQRYQTRKCRAVPRVTDESVRELKVLSKRSQGLHYKLERYAEKHVARDRKRDAKREEKRRSISRSRRAERDMKMACLPYQTMSGYKSGQKPRRFPVHTIKHCDRY